MKTWHKAIKLHFHGLAAQYPDVYRRLTPREISTLTSEAWAEVSSQLRAAPAGIVTTNRFSPDGVYCRAIHAVIACRRPLHV